jgi:hypothetical protein
MRHFFVLLVSLGVSPAWAKQQAHPDCFDFAQPITKPMVEPIKISGKGEIVVLKKLPSGALATSGRGIINKPIKTILTKFLDPMTTRSPEKTKLELKQIPSPHFFKLEKVSVSVKVIPLLTIDWEELWAYALVKGTLEKPSTVLITYEKIDGTAHLKYKCGNIMMTQVSPTSTDVYLYEEVDATRWDEEKAINHFKSTFATLKTLPTQAKN